jgi:polyribonucleotide nucleotidyltransferase
MWTSVARARARRAAGCGAAVHLSPFISAGGAARGAHSVSTMLRGKRLRLEVGRLGPLADAVVFAQHGDTVVTASAVGSTRMSAESSGVPLSVEYRERASAYGTIPGTTGRREPGAGTERETLAARVIDRVLRPLFKKGYFYDTQLTNTLQSFDPDCDPVALAIVASSAALHVSAIPWAGPAAAVRVALPPSPLAQPPHGSIDAGGAMAMAMMTTMGSGGGGPLSPLAAAAAAASAAAAAGTPVVHPTALEAAASPLDFLYAGADDLALMIEAEGKEVREEVVASVLRAASAALRPALSLQRELREIAGQPKRKLPLCLPSDELLAFMERSILPEAKDAFRKARTRKEDRGRVQAALQREAKARVPEHLAGDDPRRVQIAAEIVIRDAMRAVVMEAVGGSPPSPFPGPSVSGGRAYVLRDAPTCRVDGRGTRDVRPLGAEVDVLPRTHGSAIFSRGNTQVLTTTTLGPLDLALDPALGALDAAGLATGGGGGGGGDGGAVETPGLVPLSSASPVPFAPASAASAAATSSSGGGRHFFLHYDFPGYCTNEMNKPGGNRRMVGHGALAEKALRAVLPSTEAFPYAIRVTAETSGSDGSSSMASVCGATLALLDAGVPLSAPVAGVSVGCMSPSEDPGGMLPGSTYTLLTDIFGLEDFAGDMDFKVAGTEAGVTGIQLDMKPAGLPLEVLEAALWRAREARLHILGTMRAAMPAPRAVLKPHTPRAEILDLPPELRSKLIGPGGTNLRKVERLSGARLMLDDEGTRLFVYAPPAALPVAKALIYAAVAEHLRVVGSPLGVNLQPLSLPTLVVGVPVRTTVLRTNEFGAVLGVRGTEAGWLHVSEVAKSRGNKIGEYMEEGDDVTVQVIDVDAKGRGRFSLKSLIRPGEEVGQYIQRNGKGKAIQAAAAAAAAAVAAAANGSAAPTGQTAARGGVAGAATATPYSRPSSSSSTSSSRAQSAAAGPTATGASSTSTSSSSSSSSLTKGFTGDFAVVRVTPSGVGLSATAGGAEVGFIHRTNLRLSKGERLHNVVSVGDSLRARVADVVRGGSGSAEGSSSGSSSAGAANDAANGAPNGATVGERVPRVFFTVSPLLTRGQSGSKLVTRRGAAAVGSGVPSAADSNGAVVAAAAAATQTASSPTVSSWGDMPYLAAGTAQGLSTLQALGLAAGSGSGAGAGSGSAGPRERERRGSSSSSSSGARSGTSSSPYASSSSSRLSSVGLGGITPVPAAARSPPLALSAEHAADPGAWAASLSWASLTADMAGGKGVLTLTSGAVGEGGVAVAAAVTEVVAAAEPALEEAAEPTAAAAEAAPAEPATPPPPANTVVLAAASVVADPSTTPVAPAPEAPAAPAAAAAAAPSAKVSAGKGVAKGGSKKKAVAAAVAASGESPVVKGAAPLTAAPPAKPKRASARAAKAAAPPASKDGEGEGAAVVVPKKSPATPRKAKGAAAKAAAAGTAAPSAPAVAAEAGEGGAAAADVVVVGTTPGVEGGGKE